MTKPFRLFGGTVRSALVHAATRYDMRCEAAARRKGRTHNHYAIAHYLRAVDEISTAVEAGQPVREAICAATCDRLRDNLLRAVNEPIATPAEIRAADRLSYAQAMTPR